MLALLATMSDQMKLPYLHHCNTSGPLNRGGIVDLPLLKTLLANRQKLQERLILLKL